MTRLLGNGSSFSIVVGLFVALAPVAASGQAASRADSARRADSLVARGDSLRADSLTLPAAVELLREAVALRTGLGDDRATGAAWHQLGRAYAELKQRDSAMASYRRALALRRAADDSAGVAASLNNIGTIYYALRNADSAAAYFDAAVTFHKQLGDSVRARVTQENLALVVTVLDSIGESFARRSQLDSAARYFAFAIRIATRAENDQRYARAASRYARHMRSVGRYDSAFVYYRAALGAQREVGDTLGQVTTLGAIADLHYTVMQFDSAVAVHQRRLSLARAFNRPRTESLVLTEIAMYYGSMVGGEDSAVAYGHRALAIDRTAGDSVDQGWDLRAIGRAHRDADSGWYYLSEALRTAEASRTPRGRTLESEVLRDAGIRAVRAGQADTAVYFYRRALAIHRERGNVFAVIGLLQNIANAYRARRPAPWPLAAAYLDSAWTELRSLHARAGDDAARIALEEQFLNLTRLMSDTWQKHADEAGDQASARRAFAAGDRIKAVVLADRMRGSAALTTSLDEEADALVRAFARPGVAVMSFTKGHEYIGTWVLLPSGRIEHSSVQVRPGTVARAVSGLRQSLQVDSASVRGIGVSLEPATRGFEPSARAGPDASLDARLDSMSALLFPAATRAMLDSAGVTELILVPGGELTLVPFAALPLSRGEPLASRYRLRFGPSLTALMLAEARERPRSDSANVLVVGDPTMPSVSSASGAAERLSPLPGAKLEATTVAQLFGASHLTDDAASEAVVRRRLPAASIVHLATHGYAYANSARQRDSFIAFAPGDGHDGLLTVGEVLDEIPSLRADFVVLSACQTGLGTLASNEGTVGLQRAFLAKGARSVLVSLWSVSDEATELLMRRFYRHWTGGMGKAEALQRAQMDVRGQPGSLFHHPRFWAAFQLVGAD